MKFSKDEVNYSKGHLHSHCGQLTHDDKYYCRAFIPGPGSGWITGSCRKVAGRIVPDFWCEEYTRVKSS